MPRYTSRPAQEEIHPLRFTRPALISDEQSARVDALAKRILQEIGMEVRHETALARLRRDGHRIEGDRVFFEPAVVEEHIEAQRRYLDRAPATGTRPR